MVIAILSQRDPLIHNIICIVLGQKFERVFSNMFQLIIILLFVCLRRVKPSSEMASGLDLGTGAVPAPAPCDLAKR